MNFETGNLYHIYNQGNNRQKIFFSRENYLFFLNKIKNHILPHADILAWCLMPNHFHLMVYVHDLEIEVGGSAEIGNAEIGSTTLSRATNTNTNTNTNTDRIRTAKIQTLNKSIAILLTSYTRAINIQENRSGSLFKPHTKAECLTKADGITPSFYGSHINVRIPEKEYPQVCFNYIHQNPVNANLVKLPEEWEFSSYPDYCGIRDGKLINRARAVEFELMFSY
jgi:putative transposase